jgi:hypothetical protein
MHKKEREERTTTQQVTIAGNKKYLSKKHKFTLSSTRGACEIRRGGIHYKSERSRQMTQEEV